MMQQSNSIFGSSDLRVELSAKQVSSYLRGALTPLNMTDNTNPSAGAGNADDVKQDSQAGQDGAAKTTPPTNDPAGSAAGDGSDKKPDGGDDTFKDDGAEPPRRKDARDFIIQRKEEKIKRMEAAAKQKAADGDDGDDSDDDDGDDAAAAKKKSAAAAPQLDEETIAKIVEQRFPQLKAMQEAELKGELGSFISKEGNEVFKPYEAKILRYAAHPSRAHLPIEAVAYEVAGPHLLKLGIKMAEEAREKAGKSKTGGGTSPRAGAAGKSGIPNVNEMTLPQFNDWLRTQKGQG